MNTTDQLSNQGGIDLPYGAISEQQTLTNGYGARYGRSTGGVISQISKTGTNTWHFGVKALWQPSSWRAHEVNQLWNNVLYKGPNPADTVGKLRTYRQGGRSQEIVYDAYVGGPIIKNRLFFFVAAEQDRSSIDSIGPVSNPFKTHSRVYDPKLDASLSWNITNSNILKLTFLKNSHKVWRSNYKFDYDNLKPDGFSSLPPTTKDIFRVWIVNYTSYITDNLTVSAMLGKMHADYGTFQPAFPGFDPTLPHIAGAAQQNPLFTPNGLIVNGQSQANTNSPDHKSSVMNYHFSINYKWRNHDFEVGIDNLRTTDSNDGPIMTGPGYEWVYEHGDPTADIIGSNPAIPPWAGPPDTNPAGAGGFYVEQSIFQQLADLRIDQRAQYIQDEWQVTPRLLLSLGLRNDQFTNYNPGGIPYVRLTKPQWAPRLGFSWDVHGDQSLKLFANAGRYYLDLPANTALRDATSSLVTIRPFTYTGIDPKTGVPIGLKAIPFNNGGNKGLGVAINDEYGQPVDPRTVSSKNIKAEYSDNFIAGLKQAFHMFGGTYVFGASGVLQKLGPDTYGNYDDMTTLCQQALAQGAMGFAGATKIQRVADCISDTKGFMLNNPTQYSVFLIPNDSGVLQKVSLTRAQMGFDQIAKRKYYALNLSLTHPFDGKWFGKVIYTWSRSYGTTEGSVESLSGQVDVAMTAEFNYPSLGEWSNGPQPNNHTNQLRAYGSYQINPDWRVGGVLFVESGAPFTCLGYFGPNETNPVGYGSSNHWCGGKPTPPGGFGNTPWIHTLDLNINYSPSWGGHKLNFNFAIFNVFNSQTATMYTPGFGRSTAPSPTFKLIEGYTPPRSARFYISYDY